MLVTSSATGRYCRRDDPVDAPLPPAGAHAAGGRLGGVRRGVARGVRGGRAVGRVGGGGGRSGRAAAGAGAPVRGRRGRGGGPDAERAGPVGDRAGRVGARGGASRDEREGGGVVRVGCAGGDGGAAVAEERRDRGAGARGVHDAGAGADVVERAPHARDAPRVRNRTARRRRRGAVPRDLLLVLQLRSLARLPHAGAPRGHRRALFRAGHRRRRAAARDSLSLPGQM